MKLFDLTEPTTDVVLYLNEHQQDPKMALVEASLRFGLPTDEILAIYRRHLRENGPEELPTTIKSAISKFAPTYKAEPHMSGWTVKFPTKHGKVELRFGNPTGSWKLYACNDACTDEMWESIQAYLKLSQ